MKEAEKIINCSEYWFNKDKKNRTAVVILANNKEDETWAHAAGTSYAIARLIYLMMLIKDSVTAYMRLLASMHTNTLQQRSVTR